MSGSNQHTIPQIMLRGFGRKNKAKAIQVVVYRQDKIFSTGTRGIGAERFFYSPLGAKGETTLDDIITQYEQRLDGYIEGLRTCAVASDLPSREASEIVVHLTVRTAQVRNSFAQGAGKMMQGMAAALSDPEKRWRLMGFHLPKPTGEAKASIEKAYIEGGFRARGFPRKAFFKMMFDGMKANFRNGTQTRELEGIMKALVENAPEFAASGHRTSLAKGLAPELRVHSLQSLTWQVHESDFDLVLPDCVAIEGSNADSVRPLVYAPNDTVKTVFMPITSRRILVGYLDPLPSRLPLELNMMLASCSHEYFVALDRMPQLERLVPEIGNATTKFMDSGAKEAIEDLIRNWP